VALIVLDAYALIGFLLGDPTEEPVRKLLKQEACAIPSVNLAETIDKLVRVERIPPADVDTSIRTLIGSGLGIYALDQILARHAGLLRAEYYHRRNCPVSLSDCVLLVTAREDKGSVATSDPAVVKVARAESVDVLTLPDSRGVRP
jgi:PIN domain nuclease of toxin-antitoxin system